MINHKLSLSLTILIVSLLACSKPKTDTNQENHSETNMELEKMVKNCYLFTEEGSPIMKGTDTLQRMIDSTILTVELVGEKVSGKFENKPAEQDAMIGTYSGRKRFNGLINGVYNYSQEGDEYQEFIQVMLTENKAHFRFVKDTMASEADAKAGEWFMMSMVDCK